MSVQCNRTCWQNSDWIHGLDFGNADLHHFIFFRALFHGLDTYVLSECGWLSLGTLCTAHHLELNISNMIDKSASRNKSQSRIRHSILCIIVCRWLLLSLIDPIVFNTWVGLRTLRTQRDTYNSRVDREGKPTLRLVHSLRLAFLPLFYHCLV